MFGTLLEGFFFSLQLSLSTLLSLGLASRWLTFRRSVIIYLFICLLFNHLYQDPLQCTCKIPGLSLEGLFEARDTVNKSGGGFMAYINDNLNVIRRTDLENQEVEVIWLEVCPFKSKRSLLIASIYRPPSYTKVDYLSLEANLEGVYLLNKETIFLGDVNIDGRNIACKQALLLGKPRENARARGRGKESLQRSLINFHFHPGNSGTLQSVKTVTANVPQIRKVKTACQV